MFKIAIIGKPNVGKSTLFNKLVGRQLAITDNISGVTRDRKESKANLGPLKFIAIDTAGLENEASDESLERRMFEQTENAVMDADLCLFVVDGKNGLTQKDKILADLMRKKDKKIILVVNKFEGKQEEVLPKEYYRLGFPEMVAISAEHREGFPQLYDKIEPVYEKYEQDFAEHEISLQDEDLPLQIAIVGKPNAGKSTFLNKILGAERLITGPEAGITRDAIAIDHKFQDQKIRFIDTAGIRKKSNITEKLENLSATDSFRAINFSQVVILLIDANSLLDHQDAALAGQILREGRGLIFAINKIDTVKGDKEVFLREVRKQIQEIFKEVDGIPILGVSAKSGYNVEKTLEFAIKVYEQWQTYLPTSKLHEWLKMAELNHPPKLMKGKETKLKYVTQIKRRPPSFAVFTNYPKAVEGAYLRYLANSLRETFDLSLTPIRMVVRKSDNPFAGKKEKTFSKKTHKSKK
ncbi:MAG: ribosome biogenesis GTPase Der [Pelagibacterales bacterium]|nr:ribosome biogenesis GTPase Der [Pelagibacterales bacterium]